MNDASQGAVSHAVAPPRKMDIRSPADAGLVIRKARDGRNMNLSQLAGLVRCSPPHLSRVELGCKPSEELLDAICRTLDLDPAPLFCAWRMAPARAAAFWDPERMREALAGGAS